MKIEVRFRGMEASETLREHVLRRIHLQLSRFDGEVGSVVVRIADVNGPKGGVDKRCNITVRGPALAAVIVEDLSADTYSAVVSAAERAARAVGRELERVRTARRESAFGKAS